MQEVTIAEAKIHLPELIDAALKGEEVLITDDQAQVVRLVAVATIRKPRKAGSAKGLFKMQSDFDEPLDDFKDYLEGSFCWIHIPLFGLLRMILC